MNVILLILVIMCFYKSKNYVLNNKFNKLYLSKETTTTIKGVFVLLVFLSHLRQYLNFNSNFDSVYLTFQNYLGQLIVCVFLFYSGYGIYETFKIKGQSYIKKMPKNRILKTLIHFFVTILIYLILNILIGNELSFNKILLSFIGWDSIGNSNWFIFTILCCYISTYISFVLFKNNKVKIIFNFIFIFAIFCFLYIYKESWWYDTIFCYIFGIIFSAIKDKFEKIVLKNNFRYYIFSIIILFMFLFLYQIKQIYVYEVVGILFCLLIVLFSLKFNIKNKILVWFGNNVFSIYILQRIPMIILSKYFDFSNYIFVLLAFICTILISILFNKIIFQIDKLIFKREEK